MVSLGYRTKLEAELFKKKKLKNKNLRLALCNLIQLIPQDLFTKDVGGCAYA